jgi:PEP-CTERM motif
MKKMKKTVLLISLVLLWTAQAWAVPTLQVGAPGGAGEGTYADYVLSLSDPTETDTAVTYGNELLVAGLYASKDVVTLGGQSTGDDWSAFGLSDFNGHGAILIATVPESQVGTGSLTVDSAPSFLYSANDSHFPNNHAPVGDPASAYFFFDIGDFSESVAIPDFADESIGGKDGEIKSLALSITGFDWVHFDVMALQTTDKNTSITTTAENNPGSHDVTWKEDDGGADPQAVIPEPGTIVLVGGGLVGLAFFRRKQLK